MVNCRYVARRVPTVFSPAAAFALPAHENEVKFPLKNRANGLTVVAGVVVPVHVA